MTGAIEFGIMFGLLFSVQGDTCQPGYYNSVFSGCQSCKNSGCTCTLLGDCDACLEGYYRNDDRCFGCPSNCKTCASSSSCSSCDPGYYGFMCQQVCGRGCIETKCEKETGTCLCRTDLFSGVYCNTCVLGKFGKDCDYECLDSCYSCSEATNCDSCRPGFFGHICEHNCSENCYNCSQSGQCLTCNTGHTHPRQTCVCTQSKCATSADCDKCVSDEYFPDNGSCCPCSLLHNCKSCKVSSNGTKCVACGEEYYPNEHGDCFNCSVTCVEGQCDSVSGECKQGCTKGYWGKLCKQKCQDSCYRCNRYSGECLDCNSKLNYGPNCTEHCSETCVDKVCDILGVCTKGCSENYFGEMCENECDKHCIQSGPGSRCSSEIGECLHGCTAGYIATVCPIVPQGEEQNSSSSRGAAIGGGVGGGVLAVLATIAVIAFIIKRKKRAINRNKETATFKPDQNNEEHIDLSVVYTTVNENQAVQRDVIYANTGDGTSSLTVNSNSTYQTPPMTEIGTEIIQNDDSLEIDEEDAFAREIAIRYEENGGVYYNNSNEVNKTKVKVEDLPAYVTEKTKCSYQEEFEKFPYGLTKPCEDSQNTSNMSRNRYKGIYPYDDSRVKVWFDGSDYINASFIDGFKTRNEYIATLGPMSKQLGDFGLFWKMVWQQKVEKVVMVTNLIEGKTQKCEQYWPNVGSSARYGKVNVTCLSEDEYTEFTRRTFQIYKNSEERKLQQFHFTCWPDKSVPEDVPSLIEFRKMVLNSSNKLNGPTLVHCSAGVGRTGTYIALDILTKEGEAEGSIDVPGCVLNMRRNRPNMIQTLEQYQFLHRALVHSLTLDCSPVKEKHDQQFVDLRDGDKGEMYQNAQFTPEQYLEEESQATERNKTNEGKSRANADIPVPV